MPQVRQGVSERLRKRPVQERSRRRFEAMLDAAAELFAEQGVDAVTMEAIAAKAGTSIGSLYQYFPDKQALFVALSERVLERSRVAFGLLVDALETDRPPWQELLDRTVDAYAAMLSDPSLRAVWLNIQLCGSMVEADVALHEEIIEHTTEILAGYVPGAEQGQRRRIATMIVDVVGGVLFMASRRDPERASEMLGEVKVLLRRYLEPYLGLGDAAGEL